MSENYICSSGLSVILGLIGNDSTLKILDLSKTCIYLSENSCNLENNTFFESLDLSYCTKHSFRLHSDTSIVKDINTLKTLNLSNNSFIGGFSFLYKIIENNKALKKINLSNNIFDSEAISKLAESLEKNDTLIYLNLRSAFEKLSIESFESLINVLIDHKSIKHIDFSDNECLKTHEYTKLIKKLKKLRYESGNIEVLF